MGIPIFPSMQVASAIPYDDSIQAPQISVSDLQAAVDYLKANTVGVGPTGISTSAVTATSITSTTYVALNSMSVTTTAAGNWAVLFTGQMTATADVGVLVYVGGVQIASSERIGSGPAGSHLFVLAMSEKITGATIGATVEVRWKSSSGASVTCTGRNLTIVKVT